MKVAFVGTGGIANRHLAALADEPGVTVVGHVSGEPSRAEAQAARWGGRAYADIESLLERERPEAVWVCVTPDRHGRVEEVLIERGIPFFVEKPLAADLATGERIAAALERRPVVAAVGYKLRALDTLPRARELLAERPTRMLVGAWHDATPSPAWWRQQHRSGGQVVEQATHLVDLARLLVGEGQVVAALARREPRAAYPDGDVAVVSAALLRFGEGVPGTLTATCLLEGRQTIHLQLVCEGRVLTLDDRELRVETGRETQVVPVAEDAFVREDRAFLRAIQEGDPRLVYSSYGDALRTHRLCIAIREAAGESASLGVDPAPVTGGLG